MCLTKLKNLNGRTYNYVQKKFWKVIYLNKRYYTLISPVFFRYEWKPYWNASFDIRQNDNYVNEAIHVFYKKEAAEEWVKQFMGRAILVPVYANGEDLIAYGKNGHAAFSKVFLKKEDYERAMKLCES